MNMTQRPNPYPPQNDRAQREYAELRERFKADKAARKAVKAENRGKVRQAARFAGLTTLAAATGVGLADPSALVGATQQGVATVNRVLDDHFGPEFDRGPQAPDQQRIANTGTTPAAPAGVDPATFAQVEAETQG
jgi:hypothetical protein